jgi:hypothetical protein
VKDKLRAICSSCAYFRAPQKLAANLRLLVTYSYWRWPERDLAGNAIDFLMRVLGLSFHDAMRQITGR